MVSTPRILEFSTCVFTMAAPALRLKTNGGSCATLYAGQSFLEGQVKQEVKENIDEDLRVASLQFLS